MKKRKADALRFTHLRVEKWRNFVSIDVDLQSRTFLVGPNASGKSNFLDVIRFLKDLASSGGGFQAAIQRNRGGVSSLRALAARKHSDISIFAQIGNDENPALWAYELTFNQDNQKRPIIKREYVYKQGHQILERPDPNDKRDPELLTQTHLEQILTNQDFREIAEFFTSIRYLHIVPQLIREPDRSVGKNNDPFGGDFLEQVARKPVKTQQFRLRRICDALKVAVPQLQDLELERDKTGTPHLRGKYEHWRPQGQWQTEEVFSDGTLRLLGLLWAVLDGRGPLLLEEPELSLHPEVVRFIPLMFTRIQRNTGRQILVSTHSSDLLRDDGIGLDEVLLLQPEKEGTSVHPASNFDEIKVLLEGGVSLADAIMPRTRPQHAEQLSLFGQS